MKIILTLTMLILNPQKIILTMKFPSAFLLCFLYLPFSALSQQLTQTVKGSVVDRDTRQPLIGAEITILYSPLDPVRSLEEERFVPRAGAEWSEQVDPYLRLDSRIAFRKARTKYAYIVSLDI